MLPLLKKNLVSLKKNRSHYKRYELNQEVAIEQDENKINEFNQFLVEK